MKTTTKLNLNAKMKTQMARTAEILTVGLIGLAGCNMAYAQNMTQFATKNVTNESINPTPIKHFVEPGDTLWRLSERYYGRALLWTDIRADNNVSEPKRLQPGTLLQLRADGLGGLQAGSANSATALAVTGDVRLLTPVANNGKATVTYIAGDLVNKGDVVPVGTTLKTGADSFITLLMPNGSRATLPSNSQMKLVSVKDVKGKDAVLLDLEAGQVDARVLHSEDNLDKPSYRIRTKLATLGARGTYFRVVLPDTLRTLVAVLEGTVAVDWEIEKSLRDVTNDSNKAGLPSAALLSVGQGSVLQAGTRKGTSLKLALVQNLLPAPVLLDGSAPQNQSNIAVRWLPVSGAADYRVQLARDADFSDVLAQQDVPAQSELQQSVAGNSTGDAYKTWFAKVAHGSYFVRVSAISTDGLEGLYALSGFNRLGYVVTGSVALSANQEQLEFSWTALASSNYWLEVADNKEFSGVLLNAPHLRSNTVRVAALPPGNYFWRVRAYVQEHGQTTTVVSDTMPMLVGGVR